MLRGPKAVRLVSCPATNHVASTAPISATQGRAFPHPGPGTFLSEKSIGFLGVSAGEIP